MTGRMAGTFPARPSSRGLVLVPLLLLWSSLTLLLHCGYADQNGFISIDCGSDSNYTDGNTGLLWSTDDGYVSSGYNKKTTIVVGNGGMQQLTTARIFAQGMSKNCYVLPVTLNSTYLIRPFFLLGELQALSALESSITFNLSIDSTVVDSISLGAADLGRDLFNEYLVTSFKTEIDFCIIPIDGDAFISSLELRPTLSTMYLGPAPSKYAKLVNRLNCGAATTASPVRYPNDPYDRLWLAPTDTHGFTSINTTNPVINVSASDKPPRAVMQSAWTSPEISFTWQLKGDSSSYYVALYFDDFAQRNSTANRSVDVSLNQKPLSVLVIENYTQEISDDNFQLSGTVANLTVTRSKNATLNPLLNAAELHAIYPAVAISTASEDVVALNDVRQHLNLLMWTGDPCLPNAWDWLTCSSSAGNTPPRITQINLSNGNVTGTLPASFAKLTQLTSLSLDHNAISGSIPNLAGLNSLKFIYLQNNLLTGRIPATLASLPQLSQLYLENNDLTGPVPPALLSKNGLVLAVDPATNVSTPAPAPAVPAPTVSPLASPSVPPTEHSMTNGSEHGSTGVKIGAVVGVSIAWIIIAALVTYCCCRCRRKQQHADPDIPIYKNPSRSGTLSLGAKPHGSLARSSFSLRMSHQLQKSYSLAQVRDFTNNFRWKIGEGGFGPVYYGTLPTTEEIAAKVNSTAGAEEMDNEFATEVGLLSVVHHRNLLKLLGYCEEDSHKVLIYEYMPKGTLRDHLYGKYASTPLDWRTRLKIASDAARGLEYLHHDCNPKIIHRDVKSNNILLNDKMLAKVADFGISKMAPEEGKTTGVITVVRGTTGYFDPEYFTTNKITQKSDVYAFGVVLLEIISGRPPNDANMADSQVNLVQYARRAFREGSLLRLIDPMMKEDYNVEAVWKVAELALNCVEPLSVNRPDMRNVVGQLLEARTLEIQRESVSSTSFAFASSQEENTQSSQSSVDSSAAPSLATSKLDSIAEPAASMARLPTVRSLQSGLSPRTMSLDVRRQPNVPLAEASPSPSSAFLLWNDLHPR